MDQLRSKKVCVYALGQELWLKYIMSIKYTDKSNPVIHSDRLIETCRSRGTTAGRLWGEQEMLLP